MNVPVILRAYMNACMYTRLYACEYVSMCTCVCTVHMCMYVV